LPSYLDRATDDLPPFEVRYPQQLGGALIAAGRAFPASWRTPKETWLLSRVQEILARGEKVIVFLRHTGSPELPARLLRLLREVTPSVAWLDAKKVPTGGREAWIDENVLKRKVKVLLVNPNAVKTGLNNLVSFSAGLWYELDLSPTRSARPAAGFTGSVRPGRSPWRPPFTPERPRRSCSVSWPRRSPSRFRSTPSISDPPSSLSAAPTRRRPDSRPLFRSARRSTTPSPIDGAKREPGLKNRTASRSGGMEFQKRGGREGKA
jgi:hypothetical protein